MRSSVFLLLPISILFYYIFINNNEEPSLLGYICFGGYWTEHFVTEILDKVYE